MLLRIISTLSVTCILTLGLIDTASAHEVDINRSGGCGWSDGRWNGCGGHSVPGGGSPSAPELDPTLLGSDVAILAGGLILLNERRRSRK
jgi:hypothetical protein